MKTVFFDAGLTLLRAHPSLGGVYTGVSRRFGVDIPAAEFETAAEEAFHVTAREHREAGEAGLRTSDADERATWHRHARRVADALPAMAAVDFEEWFEVLYEDFGSATVWRPYDEVEATLGALRERGVRMAVVSNWDRRLHAILDAHGLRPWFEEVFVSSEIGWRKPHAGIFEHALATLGLEPAEVLHVGDSRGDDVVGALGVGITPVLVDRHGNAGPVEGGHLVADLSGVPALL